jgi:hypothetical protein
MICGRRIIPICRLFAGLFSLVGAKPGDIPISAYWIDYLAVNRTCPLDSLSRNFNLIPARFHQSLDYLTV